MRNYQEASAKLNGRRKRKLENNTYLIEGDDGSIAVKLHATNVVTFFSNGDVMLSSGGWHTMTTKARINAYSPVYVIQKAYKWTVNGEPFRDGMIVKGE